MEKELSRKISRILYGLNLSEEEKDSLYLIMTYYYKDCNLEQDKKAFEEEWKNNVHTYSLEELKSTAQFQKLCKFIKKEIQDEESERSRVEMISQRETRDQLSKCQQICNCCCKIVQYMYNIYIYIYIYIASPMGDSNSAINVYNSRFDV